jgi:hypothetical protein
MSTDKSAIILEAQWMENEIPRMEAELAKLKETEHGLLTAPLETVSRAYTDTYRAERRRAHPFYHRRRSVVPTSQGYAERMADVGWFSLLARLLILATAAVAVYLVYQAHRLGDLPRGVAWGSVALILAIGLAFVPSFADQMWEQRARRKAGSAAREARQSEAFLREQQDRQSQLTHCRTRAAEVEERLKFAHVRLDELRKGLTSTNHSELPRA